MKEMSQRQLAFCHNIAEGYPPYRAYEMAGFRKNRGNCYRLKENERIRQRLFTLEQAAMKRNKLTVDDMLTRLEEARIRAAEAKQGGAEVSAIMGMCKLLGMLVDKQQTTTVDVSKMNLQEVEAALRDVLGDKADAVLRALADDSSSDSAKTPAKGNGQKTFVPRG
jgi:hypothetical protein